LKKIRFSKLNGQGNDFIIIDAVESRVDLSGKNITKMCDRNFGIGADGLILIKKSKKSDLKMEYYNRDGSVAEMCGNGIRCMARFAYDKGLTKSKEPTIETLAGEKTVSIDIEGGSAGNINVNMGTPEFRPGRIPVSIKNRSEVFNHKITAREKLFYINCVSIGNPHCVIFLGEGEDLKKYDVGKWGPRIEKLNIFPNKTNVEFVRIKNKAELDVRVWERGAGETLACGTGACAAGICAIKTKKDMDSRLTVNLPGGKLNIIWDPEVSKIYLEGSVKYSFDGEYYL